MTRKLFRATRFSSRYLSEVGLVFAVYFVGGRIGLALPFTNSNVSPIWLPAGIALSAFLLLGYRVWPGVALGAFLVNLLTPIPHAAALGIAAGNTAGPLAAAWLLQGVADFEPALTRVRDAIWLIAVAAMGVAISAASGTCVLYLAAASPWSSSGAALLVWWLGDMLGVLLVAPIVLTFSRLLPLFRARWGELGALFLGALFSGLLMFGNRTGLERAETLVAFGILPFVIWGAIRFQAAGAVAVSALIAAVAIWETAQGHGPFVKYNQLQNATLLQSFLAVVSVLGMTLAAAISEKMELVRERAEENALREGEKRYCEIAETANEGIWMLDSGLLTLFVNRRMAEMLGYGVEEMIRRPLLDFVFESDLAQTRKNLELRRRGVSEQREERLRRRDGSQLWVRVSTTPSFGSGGRFEGVLTMVSDITDQRAERRHAEEQIRLLSRAVEQIADSVLITDKQGVIEYVNPAFETTTGYSRDDVLGKTPQILKSGHHDQDFYTKLWCGILKGHPFRGTLINRKKSGQLYSAEQTITPIKDDDGNITQFVSVLKDVTEMRKQQEQDVQLRLAREVQQQFYTAAMSVPGLDIAAAAYPAYETGGDYFDFIPVSEGSFYVAIGDASGHGFGSALVMALTRAYVRSFASMELDVAEILTRTNLTLHADLEPNRFVTLLLMRLDTRNGRLVYASAGHVPGLLLDGGGEVELVLSSTGFPMGPFGHCDYTSVAVSLKPQQLIVLSTDGAMETTSRDGIEFGSERVTEYVAAHHRDSARDIAEGIYHSARAFAAGGPQLDDITSVIMKVGGVSLPPRDPPDAGLGANGRSS